MSARTILVVVLALVCGLCAAIGIQGMRKTPAPAAAPPPEEVEMQSVVIAAGPILKGEVIKGEDVQLREVPKSSVLPGALAQVGAAVGRRASIPMVKDEVVTERMLVVSGANALAPRLKEGWRAFTVLSSGPSSSLAGALEGGDHVDVLFTRSNQAGPGGPLAGSGAMILLQDVEVLAVNPKDDDAPASKLAPHEVTSATIRVKLHEAAILDQAQANGVIHLVLRGPGNLPIEPPPGTLADRVTPGKRAVAIEAKGPGSTVAGFLLPGDFVDVLHTPDRSGSASAAPSTGPARDPSSPGTAGEAPGARCETILEKVEVLAVHTATERPRGNHFEAIEIQSVTLLLDPDEAERLGPAQRSGFLGLSLRNPKDGAKAPPPPADPGPTRALVEPTRTLRGTRIGTDHLWRR